MRSERLHYFFAVTESGSLRSAAATLGLATSTLSAGIRALEAELDTALFVRDHGMKLTPQATALLPHLRKVVEAEDELLKAAAAPTTRGPTVLGTHLGYGANMVDELNSSTVFADGAAIEMSYLAGDWRDLSNGLTTCSSHLAIVIGKLSIDQSLEWEVLHREPLLAAASKAFAVPPTGKTTLAELDAFGWAPVGNGLLDPVWLRRFTGDDQRGGPPPWSKTTASTSPFELAAAVNAGHGVATAIRPFTDFMNHRGDHVLEVTDVPPIEIRLAWRKDEKDACRDAVIGAILDRGLVPTLAG